MTRGKRIFIVVIVLLIIAFSLNYRFVMRPAIKELCRTEVSSAIRSVINQANETILSKGIDYSKLFSATKSTEGNVVYIESNAGLINQISMLWGTEIQNGIDRIKSLEITKPLGAFSGNAYLARFGADTTLTVTFSAFSRTEYTSVFIRQGVNQTLHRFFLTACVEVEITSPYRAEKTVVDDTLLFCENVLNGSVPETYISSDNYSDYLDLLK